MTHPTLILVDIQNDYMPGGLWPVHNIETAADNASRLLDAWRAKGAPIIHIQHQMPSDAAPFFKPGSEGEKIVDLVAPQGGEPVIQKTRPSSFVGTTLEADLRAAGAEALVICGAMSQMCIDSTTRHAADLGFQVTVAADACGAKEVAFEEAQIDGATVHATIMGALAGAFATVTTTDAVLAKG